MSQFVKEETKPNLNQTLNTIVFNPFDESSDKKLDLKCWESNGNTDICPTIPLHYFNDFCRKLNQSSVSTNDLLVSIQTKLIESKSQSMETIQTSNDKLEDYLKLRENHFLNKLKNTEKRIEEKLDSISTDVKNTNQRLQIIEDLIRGLDSKLDSNSEDMNNKFKRNEETLQKCVTTLVSTDLSVTNRSKSAESLSDPPFYLSKERNRYQKQIKSFVEPISDKLTEKLRSVISESFTEFKKTIIDQKIMEMIGDDNKFKYNNHLDPNHDFEDSEEWLSSMLMRTGGTDIEVLRSKALDLLNNSKIIESFTIALNLSEPQFVSHLCSVFKNCPQKLLKELMRAKNSQKLIVDLLDQLIDDGVTDPNRRWKIPIIGSLIIRIDMKCPVSKTAIPRLVPKWSVTLETVSGMGGQYSEEAKLFAISLKHYLQ